MFVRTSFTFTLMTTGAFSRNFSKLFSDLKFVTDDISLYLCSSQLRSHWKLVKDNLLHFGSHNEHGNEASLVVELWLRID